MKDKETPGINPQKFQIVLDREWQEGKVHYIAGFDDYEEERCINFYHKIRKFLGLKYKVKESTSKVNIMRYHTNGLITHLEFEGRDSISSEV